jgi:hypothetical protein
VNRALLATALLMAALGLAGCATLGEGEFACPGYPGRPLCLPTSAIYRLTNGSGPPPAELPRPPPVEHGRFSAPPEELP